MGKKDNVKNYMAKIHAFVALVENDKWIKKAGQEDIRLIFQIASDIEGTVEKLNYTKFKEKLSKLYPNVDLSRSSELIIDVVLKCPYAEKNIILETIQEFLKYHPVHNLSESFCKVVLEKKLKDNLIHLSQELGKNNTSNLKKLEVKSAFSLWENLLVSSKKNHSALVIDMLNTKTFFLLSVIDSNPICKSNEVIIETLVDYLNSQNNIEIWKKLLHENNLDIVASLCDKYSKLLGSVLNFFNIFENGVLEDFDEDLNIKWSHSEMEFSKFVNVVQRFFKKDGKVRDKVNEFLISKRSDFDCNFQFWAEVSSYVYQ